MVTSPATPGFSGMADSIRPAGKITKAAKATWILDIGIMINAALLTMTGFGEPDEGKKFDAGAAQLAKANEALSYANSPDGNGNGWSGPGATAYNSQVLSQSIHLKETYDADLEIYDILKKLAVKVTQTRIMLGASEAFLGACIPVSVALYSIPVVGPLWSLGFQAGAVTAALGTSTGGAINVAKYSNSSASDVRSAISEYNRVAFDARPSGTSFSSSKGASATMAVSMSNLVSGVWGGAAGAGEGSFADGWPGQPSMPKPSTPTPTSPTPGGFPGAIDNAGEDLSGVATSASQIQQGPPQRRGEVGQQADLGSGSVHQVAVRASQDRQPAHGLGQELSTIENSATGAGGSLGVH